MVQDMMVSGEMEWQMAMVDSCMPKVMSMKESGQKIKPTDSVFTLTIMAVDTRANGFKINNTDMASSSGRMVLNTKGNTSKE